jgi:hypothetical protein
MDHLLAKTKGRNGHYFTVIADEPIFNFEDYYDDVVPYTSDYKLEEDECFEIEEFSHKEYCIDFLNADFAPANYIQIQPNQYQQIEYFCSYQDDLYFFQRVSPAQFIRRKYFSLSDVPVLVENQPILILNEFPDAIYDKGNDILYFRNLTAISKIFRGIDQLFREATQEETEQFLESSFISMADGYNATSVKTANRKRITSALEKLNSIPPRQRKGVFDYIKEYCPSLQADDVSRNFEIANEEDLKRLIFGIEERYYTTPRGKEKRLANSVIRLDE